MTEAQKIAVADRLTVVEKGLGCTGRHVSARRVGLVVVSRRLLTCMDNRFRTGRAVMHHKTCRRRLLQGGQHHEAGQDDDGD